MDGKRNINRTFQLQKFQAYQFQAKNDIGGSIVTSNKPVAVFSGSVSASVPVGIGDYQYLVEQMTPTNYWTTRFIVQPIYPRRHFVVKLFANQDNTEVHYINSTNHFAVYMNKRTLVELLFSTDPVTVLANKPISVIQYGHDGDNMDGDPFMSTTQGIAQFQNSYKFVTQNYHPRGSNTVAITILKNSTGGLLLNGHNVSYWNAKDVSASPPMDQYITLFVNVSYNSYYHLHHSSGIKFGAVIYGRVSKSAAYGYPLQLSFTDGDCQTTMYTGTTTVTKSVHYNSTIQGATMYTQTTAVTKALYYNSTTQGDKGRWCFRCDGMTHLQYCDWVERCQTEDEVCYVQSYSRSSHGNLYRSGCINPQQCTSGDGNGSCVQCCNDNFCNSKGCGDTGFQQLGQRGPICFDCTHMGEHETCNTVQLCSANQVCMIEKYKWGESDLHNKMGCSDAQACASRRSVRGLAARHSPVCSHCCHTDFCNMNCTFVDTGVPIIG
ncbi:uncharacterized protein LOC128548862 [Mercenaria mercenaria]|uniref:uncharacterized protein LOC128548862 n=1 Tax=Mercenaria mercenaria TaxID=6596 RepID=UPI00234E7FA3|nr:uncharacterized protein LOC128548862 [Mercenaria mercenaria]